MIADWWVPFAIVLMTWVHAFVRMTQTEFRWCRRCHFHALVIKTYDRFITRPCAIEVWPQRLSGVIYCRAIMVAHLIIVSIAVPVFMGADSLRFGQLSLTPLSFHASFGLGALCLVVAVIPNQIQRYKMFMYRLPKLQYVIASPAWQVHLRKRKSGF